MTVSDFRHDEVARLFRQRTENYYHAHGLCCSEAIIMVVNRGFGGGLSDGEVRRLGSGFCGGMGGGDGVCGALSGAVAALGLILGPGQRHGLPKAKVRRAAKELHDAFRERMLSTCCRDLVQPYIDRHRDRMKNCQLITGLGVELCVRIILHWRPQLATKVDLGFVAQQDSMARALLTKIRDYFRGKV